MVEELVKRLNKLEEKVKFEMAGVDKASLTGSSEGNSEGEEDHDEKKHDKAIIEEENEDDDEDSENEKPKPKKEVKRKKSDTVVLKKGDGFQE